MAKKFSVLLVCASLIGFISAISGCSTVSYYGHVTKGHIAIISQRKDISKLLEQGDLDSQLKRQLELVVEARRFAVEQLQLPDNDSYLKYSDIKRPYVVWNVFAAEELALTAKQHCFPVAGCVVYRGYYSEEKAKQAAKSLADKGYDVYVGGVAAYSTLGWFDDPLLNTMLTWQDWAIVELIFHELTHQKLYRKNDSPFNEALATAAARLGLEQWLLSQQQSDLSSSIEIYRGRQAEFNALLLKTREQLDSAYQSDLSRAEKLAAKSSIIAKLPEHYHQLKEQQWDGWAGFDRWFDRPINNARLLPVATYNGRVPEFIQLFERCDANWQCFWQAAEALTKQPAS